MENSGYGNNANKMNNTSVNLIMDEPGNKPMKRRKKKDCKHCRNRELDIARKHLAIISIPNDDTSDESRNNIMNKQRNFCGDEPHNQQILPVLNGILSDDKIIFAPTEKYWPRVMKTNSIYSEDHNQRKIKNTDSSRNLPIKIEKKNQPGLQNAVYQLNVMRGCNAIKFLIIVTILSLLAIGAVALYIVFEPEKVQILKQYLHLSKGINNSFVNQTDKPQRLIANVNRLENLSALVTNREFGILSTHPMDGVSPTESTTNIDEPEEVGTTILNSVSIRYCNNCYKGEVCISLANENVPTCKMMIDINDTTGCAGLCSVEERCHQLDENIFRCVEMEHQCLEDEWACSNALCIPLVKLCDGHMNCYDHSDEYNCDCNLQTHFQCGKNTSCLPIEQRCDGKIDCWDASDEMNCALSCLSANEFTCSDGECVMQTRFCDGFRDCSDGSDEPSGCHGRCNKHEFTCGNKRCVVRKFKCNGVDDCGDGSDELYCKH